ncbi:F-box/FBD/LRR-repeat protein At1g13570-like [Chenopodium quinoa]|uniref:F-box/FBD/LRR-repeat protein At1g13570-like n=1 Tax=Chenopodium quinoa TaxID=63459 RepID=UPI000B774869|nr:F-box/FBD/LRR-repeat protein At1g13570-like [Chenopodium quinoa]
MASSQSNIKRTKIPEPNQDLISNLPSHLAEKILKRLPLSMAAKTSVLSRKWRRYWLSIRHLVFDYTFWEEHKISGHYDYQNISNIISNILLHHNGPIHEFYLYVPQHPQLINLNLSQWLSFLSRAGIRRLSLTNFVGFGGAPKTILPSCIFACSELVKLKLHCYELNYTPPSDCMGFAHLRTLKLLLVKFKHGGLFTSLISSCPRLTTLSLEYCTGFSDLKFEHASILESLTIQGSFVPLDFKNASYLKRVSLSFSRMEYTSHR